MIFNQSYCLKKPTGFLFNSIILGGEIEMPARIEDDDELIKRLYAGTFLELRQSLITVRLPVRAKAKDKN